MPVTQAAPVPGKQDEFLSVFGDFPDDFARFYIAGDRSQRHIDNHIFAVFARTTGSATRFTVLGEDMALVFQVDQRPELAVAAQDDTASLAAVAAVRTAEFDELFTPEMARTGTAVPGTAEYLDVVNRNWKRAYASVFCLKFITG